MKKNKEEETNNNKDEFGENKEEESLITNTYNNLEMNIGKRAESIYLMPTYQGRMM